VLEPLSYCSHRCIYCFSGSASKKRESELRTYTDKEIDRIIENAKRAGVKQITILGGEPLLYPDIVGLVSKLTENGLIVHMGSNGYHATDELVRDLADAGLTQVQMNIDHVDPEEHDRIRGMPGSFERTKRAVELFKKYGVKVVLVSLMLRINKDVLPEIFRLAKEWGCSGYRVWELMPSETGSEHYNYLGLTNEEYFDTVIRLFETAEELDAEITTLEPTMHAAMEIIPELRRFKDRVKVYGCPMHKKQLYSVSFDRNIYACCADRISIGSFDQFVPPLLESYLNYVKKEVIDTVCYQCKYFTGCYGGCPTRSNITKKMEKRDPRCPLKFTEAVVVK